MAKILGIGNAVLDTVLTVDHYPNEDQEIRASKRHHQVGGNVNNSLYILQQLGHETAICATLANDPEAKQLRSGLEERGIHCQHLQTFIQGRTPNSVVTLNAHTGSRTIVHFRDLPEVSFEHFAKIEVENYDWLHFEGRNLENLPGMMNIAKTFLNHQPISLEVEKPREGIEALFTQVNLLIFSQHYAKAKGFENGDEFLQAIRQDAPNVNLVCTWGNQGVWLQPAGGKLTHIAAQKVHPIIDTLGAGDTFNAALIHKLLNKASLESACDFANKLAASKIQKVGLDDILNTRIENRPIANLKQVTNARTTNIPMQGRHDLVLIKLKNEIKAYENNCPHQNVPLNEAYKIDVNPFDNTMKCSVHDAFFKIENGECIDGPCLGEHLTPVSIRVDDKGDIFLAE